MESLLIRVANPDPSGTGFMKHPDFSFLGLHPKTLLLDLLDKPPESRHIVRHDLHTKLVSTIVLT